MSNAMSMSVYVCVGCIYAYAYVYVYVYVCVCVYAYVYVYVYVYVCVCVYVCVKLWLLVDLTRLHVTMFTYDFHTAKSPNASLHLLKKSSSIHVYSTSQAARQTYSLPSARTSYDKLNLWFIDADSDDKK